MKSINMVIDGQEYTVKEVKMSEMPEGCFDGEGVPITNTLLLNKSCLVGDEPFDPEKHDLSMGVYLKLLELNNELNFIGDKDIEIKKS